MSTYFCRLLFVFVQIRRAWYICKLFAFLILDIKQSTQVSLSTRQIIGQRGLNIKSICLAKCKLTYFEAGHRRYSLSVAYVLSVTNVGPCDFHDHGIMDGIAKLANTNKIYC